MTCDLTNGRLLGACQTGRAGIKTIFFTKYNDFASLTGIVESGGEITDLGAVPINLFQFDMVDNVGSFEETPTVSKENGTSFLTQTITMTLFHVKPADLANLNSLKKGRWVIWTLDFQNKIRLFGRDRGLVASGGSDVSGATATDKKGLDLVLTGTNNDLAIFMDDYTSTPFDNFSNVSVVSEDYSPEYQVVYNAMTNKPSADVAAAQDILVRALVADGIWAKLDVFYVFAQESNAASEALINWINPGTNNATIVLGGGSMPFVSLEGLAGDAANSYVNSNYNPSTDATNYAQDSASIGLYSRTDGQKASTIEAGLNDADNDVQIGLRSTTDSMISRVNDNDSAVISVTSALGFRASVRENSPTRYFYENKTQTQDDAGSDGVGNGDVYIFGINTIGSGLAQPSNRQLSMFFMGGALTAAECGDFQDAFEAYMDSNSKGVIT